MSNNESNFKGTLALILLILVAVMGFSKCGWGGGSGSGNTSKCTICGKSATHTFQGDGYCDTHYNDAVKWAIDHPKK